MCGRQSEGWGWLTWAADQLPCEYKRKGKMEEEPDRRAGGTQKTERKGGTVAGREHKGWRENDKNGGNERW